MRVLKSSDVDSNWISYIPFSFYADQYGVFMQPVGRNEICW